MRISNAAKTALRLATFLLITREVPAQSLGPVAVTIHALQKHYDASGKEVGNETIIKAVRNDGSSVWVRDSMNGQKIGIRSIVDVPKRTRTVVDPLTESITTYNLTPIAVKQTDCAKWHPTLATGSTLIAKEQMISHEVLHLKVDARVRNGGKDGVYMESWIAPGLGCVALKEMTALYDQAKVKAYQITEVSSIAEGEPDANLFTIPGYYTERPPSAVLRENARRTGRGVPFL